MATARLAIPTLGLSTLLITLGWAVSHGGAIENCDEDIRNQSSGLVTSPMYGSTYSWLRPFECFWRITVKDDHKIKVVFHSPFEINDLGYDWLYVYDGPGRQNQLYKFNGRRIPDPFTTTGNSLYVVFHVRNTPGFSAGGKGFSFTFTEYTRLLETLPEVVEGLVTNPGYPAKYLPNEDMAWVISVPEGRDIQLTFSDWGLVNGDQLSIYEGYFANESSIVWRLTRKSQNSQYSRPPETTVPNIFVTGNKAFLTLKTSHNGRFAINYRGVQTSACPSIQRPDHGSIQYSTSGVVNSQVTFSCDAGYKLLGPKTLACVQDEISHTTPYWDGQVPVCKASSECSYNIELEAGSGVVSSPGYPNSYQADADCSWYISTKPNYQIEVTFSRPFGIAYNQSVLDIYEGSNVKAIRLARLTGEYLPVLPVSRSNRLLFHFRANGSSSGPGFSFTYSVMTFQLARCGQNFSGSPSGVITSPGHPGPLRRGVRCDWSVSVPQGYIIQLLPTFNYTYDNTPLRVSFDPLRGPSLIRFWKQFVSFTNQMRIELDTSHLTSDQPAFELSYVAIATQVVISDATEGILQTPNYPEDSIRNTDFWWNLTAPEGHRFTFQLFDKYTIYSSVLSFFEMLNGTLMEFANVTRKLDQNKVINVDSSTGVVYIKLTTRDQPKAKIRFRAFPSSQCPPLLLDGVTFVTSGYNPGDIANVSCGPGQALSGPSQMTCEVTRNIENQSIAVWDNRQASCSADYCSQMLQEINSTFGYVESAGYPVVAKLGVDCQTTITAPESHVLAIRFVGNHLPYGTPVKIYDGSQKVLELQRYKEAVSYMYQSNTNSVRVNFKTTGYTGIGFRLVYQAFLPGAELPALVDATVCPHPGFSETAQGDSDKSSFQMGGSIHYTCPSGTLLIGSPTLTCLNSTNGQAMWDYTVPFCSQAGYSKCNKTITSGSGLLSPFMMLDYEACADARPNYYYPCSSRGNKYIDSQDCRTYFDLPEGYIVQLEKTPYIDVINNDYLMIYDGLTTEEVPLFNLTYTTIKEQPKTEFPFANFNSRTNRLLVRFTSDDDSAARGYTIKYSVIRADGCPDPPTYPKYGWLQTSRDVGEYRDGDRIRYGCQETFNLTGEFLVCNGSRHQWTGSNALCTASPYYDRNIDTVADLYTPSYPDYYFRVSQGGWNITAPEGKGIEVFMHSGCVMNAWNDGLRVTDAVGAQVLQKFFQDSWYVMNVLNVHIPEVTRIQSNKLHFTFNARDWHSSRGKCAIRLKPYDLPASCNSPLPVRHGRLVGGNHQVGQSVQLICEQGFYLPDGRSERMSSRCGEDRKWHPAISTCEAPCGGNLTAPDGVIYSPGFPDLYPEGQVCVWRIEGPVGTIISLNFSIFDLLVGQYREDDSVSVQEGSGRFLIEEATRNRNGLTLLSETSTVLLTLKALRFYRYTKNVEGLKVFYRAFTPYRCSPLQELPFLDQQKIRQQPENDTVTVEYICQYPFKVVGSPTITCLANGQWDNPEPSCAGVCGGISTRQQGAFLSPGYPQVVTTSGVCTWNIIGPDRKGLGIRLEFANVSLAEDDILAVYDGNMQDETPTYYTWQTLPMSLCGTAMQMDVRLLPRGDNSDLLSTGTVATCTNSSDCQCRRTQDGCLKCQQSTDIEALRQCLEGNGGRVTATSERELNCTILAIAHAFGELFGGTVSGINTSLNCSGFANGTDLSPVVLQCLETISAAPCIPCRTSMSSHTKFWMSYSADVPLKPCQKSDLMNSIPGISNAYLPSGSTEATVGNRAYISCSGGFVLSGETSGRINCSHSGRWDLDGAKCTCDRTFTATMGSFTPLSVSQSYREDLQCTYKIIVPERDLIRLRFETLNINANDTLIIYDGNSTNAHVLREFSDVTLPPSDVYSSYPSLTLFLKSEKDGAVGGFRIKYSAIPTACDPSRWGTVQLMSPGQEKTLSFVMEHYAADICSWRITGPPNTVVRISETDRRSYGTVESSVYEGERMEPSTLTHRSTDHFSTSYYSRTSTVWLRVRLSSNSNLETRFIFKALTSCARPQDPANGVILNTESSFTRGDVLSARCNHGYQIRDQPDVVCLDTDGNSLEWIGSMPVCNKLDEKTSPGPTTRLPDDPEPRETTHTSPVTESLRTFQPSSSSKNVITQVKTLAPPAAPVTRDPENVASSGQTPAISTLCLALCFMCWML